MTISDEKFNGGKTGSYFMQTSLFFLLKALNEQKNKFRKWRGKKLTDSIFLVNFSLNEWIELSTCTKIN